MYSNGRSETRVHREWAVFQPLGTEKEVLLFSNYHELGGLMREVRDESHGNCCKNMPCCAMVWPVRRHWMCPSVHCAAVGRWRCRPVPPLTTPSCRRPAADRPRYWWTAGRRPTDQPSPPILPATDITQLFMTEIWKAVRWCIWAAASRRARWCITYRRCGVGGTRESSRSWSRQFWPESEFMKFCRLRLWLACAGDSIDYVSWMPIFMSACANDYQKTVSTTFVSYLRPSPSAIRHSTIMWIGFIIKG